MEPLGKGRHFVDKVDNLICLQLHKIEKEHDRVGEP